MKVGLKDQQKELRDQKRIKVGIKGLVEDEDRIKGLVEDEGRIKGLEGI